VLPPAALLESTTIASLATGTFELLNVQEAQALSVNGAAGQKWEEGAL
jgi:hypothetical protein